MRRASLLAVSMVTALSACTNNQDVLNPKAGIAPPAEITGSAGMVPPPTAPATANPAAPPAPLSAAVASRTRLRFDPIVGATVESATPLTERLAARARERGIMLAGSADPSATHVMKGYFSALTEGPNTTVIYVWDVYDPSGNRLHRINGQQKVAANGAEGWKSVPPATMQSIADVTIDQLASFLAGSAG